MFEWKINKDKYVNVINTYNEKHPDESIEVKLLNNEYREAYNWLKVNAYRRLNEQGQLYIEDLRRKAYRLDSTHNKSRLSDITEIQGIINNLYIKDNAFNSDGSKNPTKLSQESIKYIKKIYEEHYHLRDDEFGNSEDNYKVYASVIKDVPEMPIFKEKYYKDFYEPEDEEYKEYHNKRNKLIPRINELLIRCIDDNGHISTTKMFNDLSREELLELEDLFYQLRDIKYPKVEIQGVPKAKSTMKKVTYNTNFIAEQAIAATLNTEDYNIWCNIFCGTKKMVV